MTVGDRPPVPPAIVIRAYRDADRAAIVALWRVNGLLRPWNDPDKDIARKQAVQPEWFLVAVPADDVSAAPIGCLMLGYDGHRGWVNYLAVDPAWQRLGIGRRLMEAAETRLRAFGGPKLSLQVRRANTAVIAFYEKLGYRQDDVVSLGKRLIADD